MHMNIHFTAIIGVAIIQFIIGALWYSPLLFGKPWLRIMGADKLTPDQLRSERKKMLPAYALQLFLTIITTVALYFTVIGWSVFPGAMLGFIVWLGFVAPTQIASVIWSGSKRQTWGMQIAIMLGGQLVSLVVAGWVMRMWTVAGLG